MAGWGRGMRDERERNLIEYEVQVIGFVQIHVAFAYSSHCLLLV